MNTIGVECELERETYLIYFKVFPCRDLPVWKLLKLKAYFLVVNFWIKAIYQGNISSNDRQTYSSFCLNSLISTLSFGEIFSYFNCYIMEMILPNILNR